MNKWWLFVGVMFLFLSCKKEHSCTDGVFSPDYEAKTDCGKTCPACFVSNVQEQHSIYATFNGEKQGFNDFTLTKNAYWILYFHTDSIYVTLNLGMGQNVGNQPMVAAYSSATYGYTTYSTLVSGSVGFASFDTDNNEVTGIFNATFVSSLNDTLRITSGVFENIPWE